MELIQNLLENYKARFDQPKPNAPKSERQEIFDKIVTRLNADRTASGRKAMGAGIYAIKMAQANIKTTQDYYWIDGYCNDAKNYSSTWWWYIKEKKVKKSSKTELLTPPDCTK